jgi:hypothetical protein
LAAQAIYRSRRRVRRARMRRHANPSAHQQRTLQRLPRPDADR